MLGRGEEGGDRGRIGHLKPGRLIDQPREEGREALQWGGRSIVFSRIYSRCLGGRGRVW